MGNEGPKTSDPSKYIRYIYNRVILENATVRASAVSTLAKFGALVDSLKVLDFLYFNDVLAVKCVSDLSNVYCTYNLFIQPRIFVLLRRCLFDGDDEVSAKLFPLKILLCSVFYDSITLSVVRFPHLLFCYLILTLSVNCKAKVIFS